jgi:acylphosphatase
MSSAPAGMASVHIWVSGRVQGVGFRAYVEHVAARLGLTGWVRNVGRDTVEAVAEGERAILEGFVEAVKKGPPSSRVENTRLEWGAASGEFGSFEFRNSA